MHDAKILPGFLQLLRGQDVAVLQPQVILLVEEPLPLNPGHVQDIQIPDHPLQVLLLDVGDVILLQRLALDVAGHLQLLRADEHKPHVLVPAQGVEQGMHRAAELQVAAQPHRQAGEAALFPADGQQVRQGLGGVRVAAVPRVDHGYGGVHGGHPGRSLLRMAHGDNIRVAADGLHRVRHALPLRHGAGVRPGHGDHVSAQLVHGRLKAQAGPGAGLKEEGRQFFPPAGLRVIVRVSDDILRPVHQRVQLLQGKIRNINHTSHGSHFPFSFHIRPAPAPDAGSRAGKAPPLIPEPDSASSRPRGCSGRRSAAARPPAGYIPAPPLPPR